MAGLLVWLSLTLKFLSVDNYVHKVVPNSVQHTDTSGNSGDVVISLSRCF